MLFLTMTRVKKHQKFLSLVAKMGSRKRKALIRTAGKDEIDTLSECCHNLLKGKPKIPDVLRAKLFKHRRTIHFLAKSRNCWKKRKHHILQRGGAFLPLLLGPIISGISGLIGSLINKQ